MRIDPDMIAAAGPMWTACAAVVAAYAFLLAPRFKCRPGSGTKSKMRTELDPNSQDARNRVDRLLYQLAFRSLTDYEPIRYFQIDVLRFRFLGPMMPPAVQYNFFSYAQELDLSNLQAVMKLCMWLEQRGVKYTLRFRWCGSMTIWYNLSRITMARDIRRALSRCTHAQIMAYNLETCPYARKKR